MNQQVYSIEKIKKIVEPIANKYKVEQAILFGSYARNDATPDSDIDIYIIGGAEFEPTDIFCVADELFENAGKNVDVYEQREINPDSELYYSIMNEGVRIA